MLKTKDNLDAVFGRAGVHTCVQKQKRCSCGGGHTNKHEFKLQGERRRRLSRKWRTKSCFQLLRNTLCQGKRGEANCLRCVGVGVLGFLPFECPCEWNIPYDSSMQFAYAAYIDWLFEAWRSEQE